MRVVLGVNLCVFAAALTVAFMGFSSSEWSQPELVLVIGMFAVASELLATRTGLSGYVSSSAPYALAIVLLDPLSALLIGLVPLLIDAARRRMLFDDLASNLASYAAFLVGGSLLFGSIVDRWNLEPAEPAFLGLVLFAYLFALVVSDAFCAACCVAQGISLRQHRDMIGPQLGAEVPSALLTAATLHAYAITGLGALALLALVQLIFHFFVGQLVLSQERARVLAERARQLERLHADVKCHSQRIAELAASRGRLVGQVLDAEERERRRLADGLHDEALQNLLTVRQDLVALDNSSLTGRTNAAVEATIDQLRDAIFDLYPGVLDQLGLGPALRAVAERQTERSPIEPCIEVADEAVGVNDALLFSLGRELIINAARHANATKIRLHVGRMNDRLVLEASDDGCGISEDRRRAALRDGHIGLASSAERIEALGGSFVVESGPGRGTSIRALIPIA